MLKLKTEYTEYNVVTIINNYSNNNTLAVSLFDPMEGPVCMLTVNIPDSDKLVEENKAYVDTNNCPEAEDFIEKNGLGKFLGIYGNSGYCTYPLYEFDLGKLREHSS